MITDAVLLNIGNIREELLGDRKRIDGVLHAALLIVMELVVSAKDAEIVAERGTDEIALVDLDAEMNEERTDEESIVGNIETVISDGGSIMMRLLESLLEQWGGYDAVTVFANLVGNNDVQYVCSFIVNPGAAFMTHRGRPG